MLIYGEAVHRDKSKEAGKGGVVVRILQSRIEGASCRRAMGGAGRGGSQDQEGGGGEYPEAEKVAGEKKFQRPGVT